MKSTILLLMKSEFLHRFIGRAGFALSLRVAWAVLNYLGVWLLARWLRPEDYGVYGVVMTTVMFASTVCGLGAQTSLLRLLGEYGGQDKPGLARGAITYAYRMTSTVSGGATLCLLGGVWIGAAMGRISQPQALTVGFLLLPAFTLIDVQGGIARSYGSIFLALAPKDVIWRALLILFGFLAVNLFPDHTQVVALLAMATIALTILALTQRLALKRMIPERVRLAATQCDATNWRQISFPIWLSAIAAIGLSTLDVILVGTAIAPEQAGHYFAASRTAALVSFLLTSTNLILAPEIARAFHAGRRQDLRRLLKMGASLVFLPSAGVAIMFIVFAKKIMLTFGPTFGEMWPVLAILSLGQLINATTGCVGIVLNMTGHQKKAAEIQISSSLFATLAGATAAFTVGPIGVACASAAGLAVWNLRAWHYARTKLKLDPSFLGVLKP